MKEKTGGKKEAAKVAIAKKEAEASNTKETKDNKDEEAKLKKEYKKASLLFNEADAELGQMKAKKLLLEEQLHSPEVYEDRLKLTALSKQYSDIESSIKVQELKWESLFDALSKFE